MWRWGTEKRDRDRERERERWKPWICIKKFVFPKTWRKLILRTYVFWAAEKVLVWVYTLTKTDTFSLMFLTCNATFFPKDNFKHYIITDLKWQWKYNTVTQGLWFSTKSFATKSFCAKYSKSDFCGQAKW